MKICKTNTEFNQKYIVTIKEIGLNAFAFTNDYVHYPKVMIVYFNMYMYMYTNQLLYMHTI